MMYFIRPMYDWSVRRRCKRLFSYEGKHADLQAEQFGRDMRVKSKRNGYTNYKVTHLDVLH